MHGSGRSAHGGREARNAEADTGGNTDAAAEDGSFITRVENNSQLMSRLQPLLPSDMTLASAAQGFKNEGQFIAAVHVSQNLKIPFAQLKAEMVRPDHDSLGHGNCQRLVRESSSRLSARALQGGFSGLFDRRCHTSSAFSFDGQLG